MAIQHFVAMPHTDGLLTSLLVFFGASSALGFAYCVLPLFPRLHRAAKRLEAKVFGGDAR